MGKHSRIRTRRPGPLWSLQGFTGDSRPASGGQQLRKSEGHGGRVEENTEQGLLLRFCSCPVLPKSMTLCCALRTNRNRAAPAKRAPRDTSSRSHFALSLMALPAPACMRCWSFVCWSAQAPAPTMPGTMSADGRMPLPVRRKSLPGASTLFCDHLVRAPAWTLQRPVPTTGRCNRTVDKAQL